MCDTTPLKLLPTQTALIHGSYYLQFSVKKGEQMRQTFLACDVFSCR